MNFKSFLSLRVPKLSGRSKFKNSVLINTLIIGAVPFFTGCAEHPVGAGGQSSAGAPVAGRRNSAPPEEASPEAGCASAETKTAARAAHAAKIRAAAGGWDVDFIGRQTGAYGA